MHCITESPIGLLFVATGEYFFRNSRQEVECRNGHFAIVGNGGNSLGLSLYVPDRVAHKCSFISSYRLMAEVNDPINDIENNDKPE